MTYVKYNEIREIFYNCRCDKEDYKKKAYIRNVIINGEWCENVYFLEHDNQFYIYAFNQWYIGRRRFKQKIFMAIKVTRNEGNQIYKEIKETERKSNVGKIYYTYMINK